MDHAIIRPSQSLVKRGGPAAQFRLSDGVSGQNREGETYPHHNRFVPSKFSTQCVTRQSNENVPFIPIRSRSTL